MKYKNLKVPFVGNDAIKTTADLFREKFWNETIPIDMEKIIEIGLKKDIIPTDNLASLCDSDALITSDWKAIYVDKRMYMDERYQGRLRFSYAHEMGHLILHKKQYERIGINNPCDFYDFIRNIPTEQYRYFEIQAQKFANYLLVPREKLKRTVDEILKAKMKNVDIKDKKILKSYLADYISGNFGVSSQVIEIALNDIENNDKK